MKSVLLIVLGRFGLNTAKKLNELKHEIMEFHINDDRVTANLPYVTQAVIGDITKYDITAEPLFHQLKKLNILFSPEGSDEIS